MAGPRRAALRRPRCLPTAGQVRKSRSRLGPRGAHQTQAEQQQAASRPGAESQAGGRRGSRAGTGPGAGHLLLPARGGTSPARHGRTGVRPWRDVLCGCPRPQEDGPAPSIPARAGPLRVSPASKQTSLPAPQKGGTGACARAGASGDIRHMPLHRGVEAELACAPQKARAARMCHLINSHEPTPA